MESTSTAVSSVSTREILEIPSLSSEYFLKVDYVPEAFKIDAKPFTDRPYFVNASNWATTNPAYTIIGSSLIRKLPGDVLRSNPSLLNAIKIGSYYRSALTLQISVSGTIAHSGMLLVAIAPPLAANLPFNSPQPRLINTLLSGPHAFLSANEATSISLEVPWYCNSDIATLDMENTVGYVPSGDITESNGNYATLVFFILNPLTVSSSSSTTLTITTDATFKVLDIMVPTPRYITYTQGGPSLMNTLSTAVDSGTAYVKTITGDFIDSMRATFRAYTGLHNPNDSNIEQRMIPTARNFLNTIDSTNYFETLDPNPNILRIVDRPLFGTCEDEMAISHIVSKKQFLGTVRVNVNDAVGTLLWSRPISPFQGGLSPRTLAISNNIELIHRMTRAWKGNIKITIQSVMNNKQQVKLRLLQMYNPSIAVLSGFPTYNSILSAPSHLMEFTAGNQTQEVVLPFLCRNNLCPNMREMNSEAIFHGLYYIYTASPLANSDGSPVDVNFNIYISLEPGFTFYGYATEVSLLSSVLDVPPVSLVADEQSLNVMNEPQDQTEMLKVDNNESSETFDRLMPLHDLRPLLRRLTPSVSTSFSVAANSFAFLQFPVQKFFTQRISATPDVATPCQILNSMFYGRTGGVKVSVSFKIGYTATDPNISLYQPGHDFSCSVNFVPVNYHVYAPTSTFLTSNVNPGSVYYRKFGTTTGQYFPVPFTVLKSSTEQVYEFKVPDTSFYKFVGSPLQLSPSTNTGLLPSTAGMGDIILSVHNSSQYSPMEVEYSLSFAYTDETRLGFHTIAPYITSPIQEVELITPYIGTPSSTTTLPGQDRNVFLYFTRT